LIRLMFPLMNASGLVRSKATSIWSSETSVGLLAAAILPAVSPACTFKVLPPASKPFAGAAATVRSGDGREGFAGDATGAAAGAGVPRGV
jgi:hypothetical protein